MAGEEGEEDGDEEDVVGTVLALCNMLLIMLEGDESGI